MTTESIHLAARLLTLTDRLDWAIERGYVRPPLEPRHHQRASSPLYQKTAKEFVELVCGPAFARLVARLERVLVDGEEAIETDLWAMRHVVCGWLILDRLSQEIGGVWDDLAREIRTLGGEDLQGPYYAAMLAAHSYRGLLDCPTAAWVDTLEFWVPGVEIRVSGNSWLAAEELLEERVPESVVIQVLKDIMSKE